MKDNILKMPAFTPIRRSRKGMVWEEEDWVDEEAVSHRSADE